MQYVSIDLETTGLDPESCLILEFAAVLADTTDFTDPEQLPSFQTYVTHSWYYGEPFGLAMNHQILHRIAVAEAGTRLTPEDKLAAAFEAWLYSEKVRGKVFAAGKNFGVFDYRFLLQAGGFQTFFRHRFLDPAMFYFEPDEDIEIPDLPTCLRRACLSPVVHHTALADAQDVVRLLQVAFAREK